MAPPAVERPARADQRLGSPSPHGTLDQAGNALEWIEDHFYDGGDLPRVLRGGSFFVDPSISGASKPSHTNAEAAGSVIGFRVAPEPGALPSLAAGAGVLWALGRLRTRSVRR